MNHHHHLSRRISACILMAALAGTGMAAAAGSELPEPGERVTVLAEDGGWGYAGRHAVIANDKLFFSYLDRAGKTWVASHDFQTGHITRNAIWQGDRDLHSSNPLLVRSDGRIQVFLDKGGYVTNRLFWKVSARPWDITEFGDLQTSEVEADITQGRQFYPMAVESTGEVYVVLNALRGDQVRETVMWRSPDGGDTFTDFHRLWSLAEDLNGNRSYTRTYVKGDDIHFVAVRVGWNEPLGGHSIGRSEGVYYVRFNTREQTFYRADGTRSFELADAPVYDTDYFDEIWNWSQHGRETQRALWSDVVAGPDGRPYVAFAVQDAVPRGESTLHAGYWATADEAGQWQAHRVAELARGWDNTPERKNYAIAIDPADPHRVFVARSADAVGELSQVHKMITADGGRTWRSAAVLSDQGRITTVVVPRVLDESARKFDILWLDGLMEGWRDYATKIMTLRKDDTP